ncbi:hypothetical protein MBLNU459_g2296t1 [Dothideomycetes sp. NU459]
MSTHSSAEADQKRPPGPHNPDVEYVVAQDPPKDGPSPAHKPSSRQSSGEQRDQHDHQDQPEPTHQRFVLTDPIAFRYLEEDSAVTVLERRRELPGYEIYVVEQWATSRTHPTFAITTFTGDQSTKCYVGVLSVPTDESTWSQRLKVYFKALNQYHARRRDTPLGILMITNLSGFPSSLTVIPVPDGDIRKHRFDFFVSENLKRMGCSGRVGLTLTPPNGATIAKFHQLYRTSDKNPLYSSVIELVKLCQAALNLFDKLEIVYADGLLCDVTEKAINDWWIGIGAEFYSIEPHDGILGPITVAALLGLLLGARNRLHACGATVPKDPFDIEQMKRGISQFQKGQRINKTRRLDRQTLERLHRVSAKAASAEGWSVPRAVKSTVAELSGKGGEMLAEAVGRRDKAGIADIEVPDIERFKQLVYGERCRWLWQGKPLKHASVDLSEHSTPENKMVFKSDDHGGFAWTGRKHTQDSAPPSRGVSGEEPKPSQTPSMRDGDEDHIHRSVTKRATGLISDGRKGFGRFKDAVRGHHHTKSSKDESSGFEDPNRPTMQRSHTSPTGSPIDPTTNDRSLDEALQRQQTSRTRSHSGVNDVVPGFTEKFMQSPMESQQSFTPLEPIMSADERPWKGEVIPQNKGHLQTEPHDAGKEDKDRDKSLDASRRPSVANISSSIAGSIYHGVEMNEVLPEPASFAQEIGPLLRRTNSYSEFLTQRGGAPRSDHFFPRHLSFSVAEDSTSHRTSSIGTTEPRRSSTVITQFEYEATLSSDLKALRAAIATLDRKEGSWTRAQIYALRDILSQADNDVHTLENSYYGPLHTLQDLRDVSIGLLRDEKEALTEGAKEIETLGQRLEYEIGALKGKVEDVEIGVDDFERAVIGVEDRVRELETEGQKAGWQCVVS